MCESRWRKRGSRAERLVGKCEKLVACCTKEGCLYWTDTKMATGSSCICTFTSSSNVYRRQLPPIMHREYRKALPHPLGCALRYLSCTAAPRASHESALRISPCCIVADSPLKRPRCPLVDQFPLLRMWVSRSLPPLPR